MKKHYVKYVFKGFHGNLSRFIAVIAIVALGVGFLVGLLSASGDLYASIDKLYDESQTMDLNIKSTIGFHKDTLSVLEEKTGAIVVGEYQSEQKAEVDGQNINTRRISRDFTSLVNQVELLEGRMPQNKNECVVIEDSNTYHKTAIGSVIQMDTAYTVVGIIRSPLFFAKEREYNLTGTGRIDLIFYVDAATQDFDTITDIYLYYPSLRAENSFDDAYFDKLSDYTKEIEELQEAELARQKDSLRNQIYTAVYEAVEEEIRRTLEENQVPEIMIESVLKAQMDSDEVLQGIEEETDKQLEDLLEKNGYTWHILDKKSNLSYLTYSQNVEKIDKIAVVFPVFFYFIAALVALTTITRLVEEERTSIGLLKSLGYSKTKITAKYCFYALTCSVIGSAVGVVLGIFILPYVIHVAFTTLFTLPSCVFEFNVLVNLISVLVMILTIFFVALYVSLRTLRERPSALLLPKSPKPGKRILLERIPLIWKRTKFKYKNTLRNIFRYKKNLIMMMIGVGGCVALLLCAFGIQSSVGSIGKSQYQDILKYDIKLALYENTPLALDAYSEIEQFSYIRSEEVNLTGDTEYDIVKITANETLEDYILLKNRKGRKITIQPGDVVISKQLADKFNLKKGSVITFEGDTAEYTVSEICQNHIGNYVYIYEDTFAGNAYLINLADSADEEGLAERLSALDNVKSIEIKSQLSTSYDSMSDSLTLIVLVIILCSGALAIIVIYNLTNININERIKEIATLKVLGYQRKEVCGYIYREIFFMSLLGILAGFVFGPFLFKFIMYNIQSPGLIFTDTLSPLFFLYAFLITIVFIGIVDLLFIPKIKKIKMVESLKCVD